MKRLVDCGTWDDPWFADLEPAGKLVFLYLLTNRRSTAAGAFEITARAMAFETGLTDDHIRDVLSSFGDRVVWWPEHQIIWVRNFYKHQYANENFRKSARGFVADLPFEVQRAIGAQYPDLVTERVMEPVSDHDEPAETVSADDATHNDPSATRELPNETHGDGYGMGTDTDSLAKGRVEREENRTDEGAPTEPRPPAPPRPPSPRRRPSASGNATGGERTPKQQAADRAFERRTGLYDAWCRGIGLDPDGEEASVGRDIAFRHLKPIVGEASPSAEEFEACTRYLASQGWRDDPPSIPQVIQSFAKWAAQGKPARAESTVRELRPVRGSPDAQRQDIDAFFARKRAATGNDSGVIDIVGRTR
ncbi:MAG TPA: hypothetical protein VNZ55_12285 [Thermomicrobiales bacterium]|nr:hypothetical protein [Thermomicrobiales bacterium]